ncbi:MAG: hypothetical protein ACP5FU_05960, partial [Nitrososphaeria archaeon]
MNAENEKLTRIIDRVLESRKDLTKDKLMELIKEKKQHPPWEKKFFELINRQRPVVTRSQLIT